MLYHMHLPAMSAIHSAALLHTTKGKGENTNEPGHVCVIT